MSLLTSALMAVAAAAPSDGIQVHEWGVVLYQHEDSVLVSGCSGGPWLDFRDAVAEAPVIYINGSDFSGSLQVTSPGRMISVCPAPDESLTVGSALSGGSSVIWTGLSGTSAQPGAAASAERSGSEVLCFQWALPQWRLPGSLTLSRRADSWCDKFLYYEVDLSGHSFPMPLPLSQQPWPSDVPGSEEVAAGQVLVFHRADDGDVTMDILRPGEQPGFAEEAMPSLQSYDPEQAFDVMLAWTAPNLSMDEARALWSTWEPYILYGDWRGSGLVVFPIPQSLLERISTLDLEVEGDIPVSYGRFFLGMVEMH